MSFVSWVDSLSIKSTFSSIVIRIIWFFEAHVMLILYYCLVYCLVFLLFIEIFDEISHVNELAAVDYLKYCPHRGLQRYVRFIKFVLS